MLRKMREEEFEPVYRILSESFPVDEKRTFDQQKEVLSHPLFEIFVWKDHENADVKGFISLYRLQDFCYVEHFAVGEKYRNEGIGQSVLKELLAKEHKICLEVEPPVTQQAIRRIEFYRRNGFYLNEYPYFQPPIAKGKNAIPLLLMTSGAPIDEHEFARIKKSLYLHVYHVRDPLAF